MGQGTSSQVLSVPIPRRLNTDADMSKMDRDESFRIHNVMPRRLPYEIRPRNGAKFICNFKSAVATSGAILANARTTSGLGSYFPYSAVFSPDSRYMVISLTVQAGDTNPRWPWYDGVDVRSKNIGTVYYDFYGGTGPPGVYNWYTGSLSLDLQNTSASYPGTFYGGDFDGSMLTYGPIGPAAYSAGVALWPSNTIDNPNTKYWDGSVAVTNRYYVSGAWIPRAWAGAWTSTAGLSGSSSPTITMTNGSTSATSAASIGTANTKTSWLLTPVGGGAKPAFQFTYIVASHSGTAITLKYPHGLGEASSDVPNVAGAGALLQMHTVAQNAPLNMGCLAVYKDRVFGGRGFISDVATTGTGGAGTKQNLPASYKQYAGTYDNALVWSLPGSWNRWPAENFAIVGEDGPAHMITGLAALSDGLVIFQPNEMWLLTGYDEDSFQTTQISSVTGCYSPNGYTVFEDKVYFANTVGIYSYSTGEGLQRIDIEDGGHGVSEWWNKRKATTAAYPYLNWTSLAVTPDGHLLVCSMNPVDRSDQDTHLVYDTRTKSWATWSALGGPDGQQSQIYMVAQAPNGKVYGISEYEVVDMSEVFMPKAAGTGVTADSVNTTQTTGQTVTSIVDIMFNPAPGRTFQIRELEARHRCHYTTSIDGVTAQDMTCWKIRVAADPIYDVYTTVNDGAIKARQIRDTMITSAASDTKPPLTFTERIVALNDWKTHGQTFRLRLTSQNPSAISGSASTPKEFSITDLYVVGDVTRTLGVDDTVA